jgi:hypothetical protein
MNAREQKERRLAGLDREVPMATVVGPEGLSYSYPASDDAPRLSAAAQARIRAELVRPETTMQDRRTLLRMLREDS